MSGLTNDGALAMVRSSTWVTANPAAAIVVSVGRLHSQHTTSRFSQFSRS